jgi:hypothetical protein
MVIIQLFDIKYSYFTIPLSSVVIIQVFYNPIFLIFLFYNPILLESWFSFLSIIFGDLVNINNIIIANYRLSENKTYKKMIQTYIAALYKP